ncbi:MAG: DNA primase [Bdellovibrionales bacterium CG12_big_fil_rev_8_21_14_0_65_38_15]|nr:MAG: DNA primase [Bdellovibrionales bacterium CG22_combo_CG10-13_8_21_14_all_38_13]PIQ52940.1 MAG: DNA primase [Bdellovibrionales bacterium CG12_big_fil_rev_8_21_14_0_65_38_15]PIR28668.1 MAG: DNA primase [Bdellovibrionales bacterium CG11_big_fil_rev_8_21_14_0_20_38_13]
MASLEDLKQRIKDMPISSLIGMYIPVTRKGTKHMAVCPFHDDNDPSMHVDDNRGSFMCFVDNTGGDGITFVQKYKNLEFVEALKDISDKLGLNFEEFIQKKNKDPKLELAQKILSKSALLYRKMATDKTPKEFAEFLEKRKLSKETAKTFQLGYAPGTNLITGYLGSIKDENERERTLNLAEEIHLIRNSTRDDQGHFDTFRDRVMFPIWDQYGHVAGFGGRQVFDYQKGKYINSQESFVFRKKQILYGMHLAKTSIRQRDAVILCEGYMDCIALHHYGFTNAVAVMGVAMSEGSLKMLKALTSNFYLALDGDDAGMKAMERLNTLALENGIVPKLIDLNPTKDPDDFLQSQGKLALQGRIDDARAFIDVLIDSRLPEKMPEVTDRKLELLQQFFSIVAPLGMDLAATERLTNLARRIGLTSDSSQVVKTYEEFLASKGRATVVKIAEPKQVVEQTYEPMQTVIKPRIKLARVEQLLVQELILCPELLSRSDIGELLDFVRSNEVQTYVSRLSELVYEVDETEFARVVLEMTSSEEFSLELKEIAGAAIFKYRPHSPDSKILTKMMKDFKIRAKQEDVKEKREEVQRLQRQAVTHEDSERLLHELAALDRELHTLRKRS